MDYTEKFMRKAIALSMENIKKGGGPFGAVIVKDGKIIATGVNRVTANTDPTAHAEVNAIRKASKKLGTFDLVGCDIYTSCEPCPMCFSAIHWARIPKIFYSTTIEQVKKLGFNELSLGNRLLKHLGKSPVRSKKVKNEKCEALLKIWTSLPQRKIY